MWLIQSNMQWHLIPNNYIRNWKVTYFLTQLFIPQNYGFCFNFFLQNSKVWKNDTDNWISIFNVVIRKNVSGWPAVVAEFDLVHQISVDQKKARNTKKEKRRKPRREMYKDACCCVYPIIDYVCSSSSLL